MRKLIKINIYLDKLNNVNAKIVINIIVIIILTVACSSAPRFTKIKIVEDDPKEELLLYENLPSLETTYGIASYYADMYHGRITYGGEVYNMNKLSAAHPSYPMNTIVRITNLSNNKKIILRINDRMPNFKGRAIDLSYAAAKELDFIEEGLTEVKIEVLKWGDGKR
ncbi:MAG: septal ring lytic transglycosylase RlpA family protein [Melioribacter sp.]|nr:septal ring lytic transglycosylase RlpA family protein [Melioribacter sp.]